MGRVVCCGLGVDTTIWKLFIFQLYDYNFTVFKFVVRFKIVAHLCYNRYKVKILNESKIFLKHANVKKNLLSSDRFE